MGDDDCRAAIFPKRLIAASTCGASNVGEAIIDSIHFLPTAVKSGLKSGAIGATPTRRGKGRSRMLNLRQMEAFRAVMLTGTPIQAAADL